MIHERQQLQIPLCFVKINHIGNLAILSLGLVSSQSHSYLFVLREKRGSLSLIPMFHAEKWKALPSRAAVSLVYVLSILVVAVMFIM